MKRITYLKSAQDDLKNHRSVAPRILDKRDAYAKSPDAFANVVTQLKGDTVLRLHIGDFRVIFEETDADIIVVSIGPRGSVYS